MVLSDPGEVFVESDIKHPVETVLDAPVLANGACEGGSFRWEGADIEGNLVLDVVRVIIIVGRCLPKSLNLNNDCL